LPSDLWKYAEVCWTLEPEVVLEIGTAFGGTAMFLADILGVIGKGRVVSVDREDKPPEHPNVKFIHGDSTDQLTASQVYEQVHGSCLTLIDGGHDVDTVRRDLELYAGLADYLVVQDTIMRWLPEHSGDPGPLDALEEWLPSHSEFVPDHNEPFPTQHPFGWLRRRYAY
jgi:cephalosporin hydroxylase